MISNRTKRRLGATVAVALTAVIVPAGVVAAHDFWLVPNALAFAAGGPLEVLGQSGTKFPASDGPTQPAQVAEARIVGASGDETIADLTVSGKSLMLRKKPPKAGQYIVAVALVSRTARTTPARLQRYIALEGAPELAAKYEQDGKYPKMDTVTQVSAKYAKVIVEVGSGGPRVFDKVLRHALEIVPLRDPLRLKMGDSVGVRLLFHGKPVASAHLRAGSAPPAAVTGDSVALAAAAARGGQVIVTGADGVATLRVTDTGLWNVRTLYAAPMAGMPEHWEAFFATIVFTVSGGSGGGDDGVMEEPKGEGVVTDSADAVAAATRFHAALAAGDSAGALALLSEDVAVLESGGVETSADYRAHHLGADIEYARALPSQRSVTGVRVRGDVAWVTATSTTQGEYRGRQVNSAGAELMVLSREAGTWKIRAIHWSSRNRRAP